MNLTLVTKAQCIMNCIRHKLMLIKNVGGAHSCIQDLRRAILEIPGRGRIGELANAGRARKAWVVAMLDVRGAVLDVITADVELLASMGAQWAAGSNKNKVCAAVLHSSRTRPLRSSADGTHGKAPAAPRLHMSDPIES